MRGEQENLSDIYASLLEVSRIDVENINENAFWTEVLCFLLFFLVPMPV
jgi:hypothetical protein